MALEVEGGDPSTALYVFRRSTSGGGVDIVRDTSEGTAGFPALEEEARNLIVNPQPGSTLTGWAAGQASSRLSLVDSMVRVSLDPSLDTSATLRAVPSSTEDRWPVTPGQVVRLYAQHASTAPVATTVTTRIVGLDAAGGVTETVAQDVWSATPGATMTVDVQGTVANAATVAVRAEAVAARPAGPVNAARGSSFEDPAEVSAILPSMPVSVDQSTAWASQGAASLLCTVGVPSTTNVAHQTAMGTPVVGKWYGVAIDIRLAAGTVWVRPALVFRSASGSVVGSVVFGAYTQASASSTARVTVQGQVPAGAARVDHGVYVYSTNTGTQVAAGASWRMDGWTVAANADTQALATSGAATFVPTHVGPMLDTSFWMLRRGTAPQVAGPYFDGDSVSSDPERGYDWLGEPNESPSVYGRHVPATFFDYEPRQGDAVDYILADDDGNQLASARVTIPLWGTWLKSPGRPSRNMRVMFGTLEKIDRPIAREAYDVEGSGRVVIYSARRGAARSDVLRLVTRSAADIPAMELLTRDGATLLLDVRPDWNIRLRYFSAGDIAEGRPLSASDGLQNLTADARLWELAEVIEQPSPQGVTVEDPGRTYAMIPAEFATYVAIPATVPTYEALATGEVI